MSRSKRRGILIAGGGLAGSLAALAMARHRPDVPLLIVEEKEEFGGSRFRSFFGRPLGEQGRALVLPLLDHRWPGYFIAFPGLQRKFRSAVGGFSAAAIHREMIATLKPDQYRLGTRVVAVREDSLVLDGGETIRADGAIDARGAANLSLLDFLFDTRVDRVVRLESGHDLDRPVLIDANLDQSAGLSFIRVFPLEQDSLLIAKSLVSERSHPDDAAGARLDHYLARRGWKVTQVHSQDIAVRMLPVGGDFDSYWRIGGARVARLGRRGGFIHPGTGSGVQDAVRNAILLKDQQDLSGSALHDLFAGEARDLWKRRQLYRDLNRKLKESPAIERRAIMQRLYGQDPALLARFHGDRLGLFDRIRLLPIVRP